MDHLGGPLDASRAILCATFHVFDLGDALREGAQSPLPRSVETVLRLSHTASHDRADQDHGIPRLYAGLAPAREQEYCTLSQLPKGLRVFTAARPRECGDDDGHEVVHRDAEGFLVLMCLTCSRITFSTERTDAYTKFVERHLSREVCFLEFPDFFDDSRSTTVLGVWHGRCEHVGVGRDGAVVADRNLLWNVPPERPRGDLFIFREVVNIGDLVITDAHLRHLEEVGLHFVLVMTPSVAHRDDHADAFGLIHREVMEQSIRHLHPRDAAGQVSVPDTLQRLEDREGLPRVAQPAAEDSRKHEDRQELGYHEPLHSVEVQERVDTHFGLEVVVDSGDAGDDRNQSQSEPQVDIQLRDRLGVRPLVLHAAFAVAIDRELEFEHRRNLRDNGPVCPVALKCR